MKKQILLIGLFLCTMTSYSQILKKWTFDDEYTIKCKGYPELTEGVIGKAALFDGVNTEIKETFKGNIKDFSITSWIAPQEYSWNKAPIIDFDDVFLGIDDLGHIVCMVKNDKDTVTCISRNCIPLLKWSHVAMTVKSGEEVSLYINGEKVGTSIMSQMTFPEYLSISLGKSIHRQVPKGTERATSKAITRYMYFDGLIDELCIYGKKLTNKEIKGQYKRNVTSKIPLKYRKLPSGTNQPLDFGAYYTKLKYSPAWDKQWRGSDFPDIVVRFGKHNPTKLVFWRGTGYIPALVTENDIWMTDQSVENFGTGECYEAMGDKQCRYSHVRLLENTPARVVVHWRYALAGIRHQIFLESETCPGDWVDEYWTAYPDGVVVRNQILWSDFHDKFIKSYQFQETIFFNQPGTKPEDNVDYQAITFMDLDKNIASYSWENGAPKSFDKPVYKPIQLVNTKSEYKPYSIYDRQRITYPFKFGWTEGYTKFPCWNHWPVAQLASDGRNSKARDKVSHSSLTQVNCDKQIYERRGDGSVRVCSMMGLTTGSIDSLLPLALSWNNPPNILLKDEVMQYTGYDRYQRTYKFTMKKDNRKETEFEILATEESPICGIPIEIDNCNSDIESITLNGKTLQPDKETFSGKVFSSETIKQLILIDYNSSKKCNLKIKFKR